MKKTFSVIIVALLAITVAGCESLGPWGPDVQFTLHNVPSTRGTLVTTVNSTPYQVELIVNGSLWGTLPPHGRTTIVFRRLYVNWYNGEQELLIARVHYRGTMVTLSQQLYASNWDRRAKAWEITPRMVEWKFQQMYP